MPERKTIQEYLEIVEEQIRWKRARPVVSLELQRHLEDQRDAFAEAGTVPEEAERLAVARSWTGSTGPGPSGDCWR